MNPNLKQFFEKLGRYNQLVDDYRRAKDGSPDHALAHVNWGIELAQKGEIEQALEKFQQASEIAPSRYEPFFNWGVALAHGNRPMEAIEKLEAALERNPKASGAHILLGSLLMEQGRFEEAKQHYEKASAINPNSPEPFLNWGMVLARQGAYEEAIIRFRQSLSLQGNQPQLFFLWGTVLAELKDYVGAIEKFRLALRFDPNHSQAYHFWSVVLNQMGRYEEALEKSQAALRHSPENAQTQLNQGDVLTNLGKFNEALPHYEKALALDPTLAEACLGWGVALCRLQRPLEADEKFMQCLNLNAKLPELRYQWGRFLLEQDRNAEALFHLQAGIELDPGNVPALLNLALAQLKMNLRGDAVETLLEIEKRDRWNAQALYLLGTHYLGEGRLDQALAYLSRALEEKPDFEEAAINLALTLCEKGDTLEAVRRLRPIIRRLPESPNINFYYGMILERHGDWQDAALKYRKAILLKPQYPEPAIGLAELYLRKNRLDEAEDILKMLLREQTQYIPALFLQGVCRIRQADAAATLEKKQRLDQRAQESFEQILTLEPSHLEAQVNLALMLGRRQSIYNMNLAFEGLLNGAPSGKRKSLLLYYWAQALEQLGERETAKLKMQEAVQENPQIAQQANSSL
jgi:tetratricopeptide (TPR) repeat protein